MFSKLIHIDTETLFKKKGRSVLGNSLVLHTGILVAPPIREGYPCLVLHHHLPRAAIFHLLHFLVPNLDQSHRQYKPFDNDMVEDIRIYAGIDAGAA